MFYLILFKNKNKCKFIQIGVAVELTFLFYMTHIYYIKIIVLSSDPLFSHFSPPSLVCWCSYVSYFANTF